MSLNTDTDNDASTTEDFVDKEESTISEVEGGGDMMGNLNIHSIMNEAGKIVKGVLLRASPSTNDGESPKSETENKSDQKDETAQGTSTEANVNKISRSDKFLQNTLLIDEITVDTQPSKMEVRKIVTRGKGGPITFLGQYESEGIIVVVRDPDDDDGSVMEVNPHWLQPPLDKCEVRGDILLMRVSKESNNGNGGDDNATADAVEGEDYPFLDYTKKEYEAFACRMDVVAPLPPEEEDDDDEDEDDDEMDISNVSSREALLAAFRKPGNEEGEDDDDYSEDEEEEYTFGEDDEEDEESSPHMMMNMLLGHLIRRFTEDNGRGPNTDELLNMRTALAEKLGIEVTEEHCIIQQPPLSSNNDAKPVGGIITPDEDDEDKEEGDNDAAEDNKQVEQKEISYGASDSPSKGEKITASSSIGSPSSATTATPSTPIKFLQSPLPPNSAPRILRTPTRGTPTKSRKRSLEAMQEEQPSPLNVPCNLGGADKGNDDINNKSDDQEEAKEISSAASSPIELQEPYRKRVKFSMESIQYNEIQYDTDEHRRDYDEDDDEDEIDEGDDDEGLDE